MVCHSIICKILVISNFRVSVVLVLLVITLKVGLVNLPDLADSKHLKKLDMRLIYYRSEYSHYSTELKHLHNQLTDMSVLFVKGFNKCDFKTDGNDSLWCPGREGERALVISTPKDLENVIYSVIMSPNWKFMEIYQVYRVTYEPILLLAHWK